MLRNILKTILQKLYRVEVEGAEHFHDAGKRVLIVANHLSFLDALLIALFLPEKPMFAVNSHIAKAWWVRPFLSLADTFALDPTNPMATKAIIDEMKKDRKCVIFPEGRITVTGSLMKVYEGPGMIADKSGAMVLPVRIDGAQYTPFSRLRGKVRMQLFPQITLSILPPRQFKVDEELKGRKRREAISRKLYDLMTDMLFDTGHWRKPLFIGVLDAMRTHGGDHKMVMDVERKNITYRQLVMRSLVLGKKLCEDNEAGDRVGVLLPNMTSTLITFLGLHAYGRVPAMLNFSAGEKSLVSACQTAKLKQVFTSKRFVEAGKLESAVESMKQEGVAVHYLEDIAETITIDNKLHGFFLSWFPARIRKQMRGFHADDAAVVLFTSGSEGTPKGVVLSHANLLANRAQLASRIDFGATDIVFNALPVFHSFGLTGGTILPLLSGIKIFFYPSPLHYRVVPELVYDINATILFGTDTFLSGYAKFAHPYDFYSVRYVFAGAEKLKEETRKLWAEKYGVRIFEGYGATETSPVLAANTPMQNRPGTVGRMMPGITWTLENVEGVDDGGKLIVSGPNIMKGYLLANNPGVLVPPKDGAYDTGDIVAIDEQGYVTIKGRAKRFAKIAGEMVSLAAVESFLAEIWPQNSHAVVAVPDPKKGEQVVMLTTCKDATRDAILKHTKAEGISELSVPRTIIQIDEIPLLGTGKTDYVSVKEIALEKTDAEAA